MKEKTKKEKQGHARLFELAGARKNKLTLACLLSVLSSAARIVPFFTIYGVVVELLWCLFRNGYLESRSGLVYGPFNPVYGIGAVIMTLTLYRYRNRSSSISFFGGAVVGSVIEYLLSWGQETLFGSTSWDYSRMPFNLDGRICLLYSLFWGILGVLWIKSLYPRVAQVILKIPNRFGKVLTWVMLLFMIVNIALSALALGRFVQRQADPTPAADPLGQFLDERFPDQRMERVYPNILFVE